MTEEVLRLLGRRTVAQTSFLVLHREVHFSKDGQAVGRDLVEHPGAVAVVPVQNGNVALVRQFRAPVRRMLLEIPAGKLDVPGEDQIVTARRECEEEVGLRPGRLTLLRTILTTAGFSNEKIHLYLGEDLTEVVLRPDGIEEERSEVVWMSFERVRDAIAQGEIQDAKTLIALRDVVFE